MRIIHLSLTNFRNYGRLELALPAGPTLLHGDNAQGKTNLLEAIYYLATTRSPHTNLDQELINWEALDPEEPIIACRLVVELESEQGRRQVEMRLIKERQAGRSSFRREALINRRKVRLMDVLGNLRVVLFLPEDVQVITGSPSGRRRYLDITLCQSDRDYCRSLSAYNKVLEQRNAQLRRIAETGSGLDVLPVYTEKLAELGSHIFTRRAAFVAALAQDVQRIHYEELTDGRETLRLSYLPRFMKASVQHGDERAIEEAVELGRWLLTAGQPAISRRFKQLLEEMREREIAAGLTRVGPHRDDWRFWVDGRDLASFGSRGQQRSAILALKLAEIHWMAVQSGDSPILLLDEVVAELDEHRRALLLAAVQGANQSVLTATDPGMFTKSFLEKATTLAVSGGRVQRDVDAPGDEDHA